MEGWDTPSGSFGCYLTHLRNSQVLLFGKAIVLARKSDFGATAVIIEQRRLCRIFGGEALVAAGGMRLRHYDADDKSSGEWRRRTS